jgi:hypothetical protein
MNGNPGNPGGSGNAGTPGNANYNLTPHQVIAVSVPAGGQVVVTW